MDSAWKEAVVMIWNTQGKRRPFGTGFVIWKDQQELDQQATYILTCTHVVNAIGEDELQIYEHKAKIISTAPEEEEDLAVLRINVVLDRPVLPLSMAGKKGALFRIAGYYLNDQQHLGNTLDGKLGKPVDIAGRESHKRIKAWNLEITDQEKLEEGYSGSPVVDKYDHAIGVVSTRQNEGKRGVAISPEALSAIWPEMPPEVFVPATELEPERAESARVGESIWDFGRRAWQLGDTILSASVQRLVEQQQEVRTKIQQIGQRRQEAEAEKNWALQRKLIEEEHDLQREWLRCHQQTQLLVAQEQREALLLLPEVQEMLRNWPLLLLPHQILEQATPQGTRPLKILLAPPEIADERVSEHELPGRLLNDDLRLGLRVFLERQYPMNNSLRPAELLDGGWKSKRHYGAAAMRALYTWLKPEPMLILEMLERDTTFSLHVAYWGYGSMASSPAYRTIGSFPLTSCAVTAVACFFAAWFLDAHHLLYAANPEQVPPLLPRLVPGLLVEPQAQEALAPSVNLWLRSYQDILETLKAEQSHSVPLLALQLAESLSVLPDKTLAHEYLNYSLQVWLELRNIPGKGQDLLPRVINTFDVLDQEYISRLGTCLDELGESHGQQIHELENELRRQLLAHELKRDRHGATLYGSY